MKLMKWAFMIWSVCVTVLILLAVISSKPTGTESRFFCAYGRVFVEFEENNKVWGTLMLDDDGRPVPCKDNYHREEYIPKGKISI